MLRGIEITDREILNCKTAKQALCMTVDRSDCSRKRMAIELNMSESHLSRALADGDAINLPIEKILPFMVICGNAVYLRYLYLNLKKSLPELENDDGACIADQVETLRLLMTETISEIKAALPPKHCNQCGAQFALEPNKVVSPRWLLAEVALIEQDFGRML